MQEGYQRRGDSPSARISKLVGRAIGEYDLIRDGDRILVAVSGGKDSLTLLHMLQARKAFAPVSYTLLAVHVTTNWQCGQFAQPESLPELCDRIGVPLQVVETEIRLKPGEELNCFACATARRNALFRAAAETNANKLAFGHHLDDIVETVLLNLFFRGEFSTMIPSLPLFEGRLTLIRPLAFVHESEIIRYVDEQARFPRQTCACPVGRESQRRKMKELVTSLEASNPNVRECVLRAMRNIKSDYLA